MSDFALKQVFDPGDVDLTALARLMGATFADPNSVLGLDRMQEFLGQSDTRAEREFQVLVVLERMTHRVVGGSVFSYVPRSNTGFSEYIVVERELHGHGLGRLLFDGRKQLLDRAAQRHGAVACSGLFIEVDSPDRTPAAFLEAERTSALEEWERLRLFEHLGFQRVDLPYVQPALGKGKVPVDYLDLLFASWVASTESRIPAAMILDTIRPIWSNWAPETYHLQYEPLRRLLADRDVDLFPIIPAGK